MKAFDKLKSKLAELFQLDQADLDFGIYRIMNARREDITRFLEHDLLPHVRNAFREYESSDKAVLKKQLEEAEKGARDLGIDPDDVPKVRELQTKYEAAATDVATLENEVYDHLYSFFSRYYDEGDFISLRRYKEGVYAIPYEGEEVKLHWANHDQYYVKSAEYFRDYAFKMPNGQRVHFKIIEADTEKDNTKSANGKDRRFFLHDDQPVSEENGELVIRFEYRQDGEKLKQDQINATTVQRVLEELTDTKLVGWQKGLSAKWRRADGTISDKTILEKHLYDYTRRNTFDYFIHKDLGGFLRRELDFYIKNEVMRLDDIEEESVPRVEQYLSKIKVIRRIAHKVIDFLAQIEDFQKKLWLKKKFVIETNYCVTLDRVPEELYPEIAANEAQREEWVSLFAIDRLIAPSDGTTAYSTPLTVAFLEANPFLVVDTKFFSKVFKLKLLQSIDDIDIRTNGILFHGDNFQALQLFQTRFREKISCVFIDPPYNTGEDVFPYKDGFRHSSWISMFADRLMFCKLLIRPEGSVWCSLDDNELASLLLTMDNHMGEQNFLANVVWQKRTSPEARYPIGAAHDYITVYAKDVSEFKKIKRLIPLSDDRTASYTNPDDDPRGPWASVDLTGQTGHATQNQYYEISTPSGRKYLPPKGRCWALAEDTFKRLATEGRIWFGKQGDARPRLKRYLSEAEGTTSWTWWPNKEVGHNQEATKELNDMFGTGGTFETVKPTRLLKRVIELGAPGSEGTCLDYFAGSGTTGHAVIDLNRKRGENRKYVLVEMGIHFDTVLLPRMSKTMYSKDWRDGKPISRQGISHMLKYIRLESYEDALANIELKRTPQQLTTLGKSDSFRESYMLKYMLDTEAKGSQTLLNIDNFEDPFSYKLLVGTGSVGETKPVDVDLVETFNWLLGLKVGRMDFVRGFRIVEGENPGGEKVLVIWRKIRDLSETNAEKISQAREKANQDLEEFFKKQQYNTLDSEFDVIYVNGDNNLMNIPLTPEEEGAEPHYKVRLIEHEFKRLMFEVDDI